MVVLGAGAGGGLGGCRPHGHRAGRRGRLGGRDRRIASGRRLRALGREGRRDHARRPAADHSRGRRGRPGAAGRAGSRRPRDPRRRPGASGGDQASSTERSPASAATRERATSWKRTASSASNAGTSPEARTSTRRPTSRRCGARPLAAAHDSRGDKHEACGRDDEPDPAPEDAAGVPRSSASALVRDRHRLTRRPGLVGRARGDLPLEPPSELGQELPATPA